MMLRTGIIAIIIVNMMITGVDYETYGIKDAMIRVIRSIITGINNVPNTCYDLV